MYLIVSISDLCLFLLLFIYDKKIRIRCCCGSHVLPKNFLRVLASVIQIFLGEDLEFHCWCEKLT